MYLVEATRDLIDNFVMSDEDIKEQVASCNEYIFDNPSDYDVIIDNSNNVYALGGVTEYGTIWLLTSYLVKDLSIKDKQRFVKLIRKQIENYKKHNPTRQCFYNTVWNKNTGHIEFIKSCGGTLREDMAYETPINETFIPFIIPNEYYNGG